MQDVRSVQPYTLSNSCSSAVSQSSSYKGIDVLQIVANTRVSAF